MTAAGLAGLVQRQGRTVFKQGIDGQQLRLAREDVLHGVGLAEVIAACAGAPQAVHGRAAAEALAQVMADGADVGALGAADADAGMVPGAA